MRRRRRRAVPLNGNRPSEQVCQRTAYENQQAAREAARRLTREGKRGWLTAYLCRKCRRYHVGHPIRSAPLAVRVFR